MKNDDGGPAFPRASTNTGLGQHGMSLLEYYAGQVLGDLALALRDVPAEQIARAAFALGEAMVVERDRRKRAFEENQQ